MGKQLRIITVCGAKGGVGTSFVANNLAIGLAMGTKKPVLLVDLDTFKGGSQASLLSLEKETEERHLGRLAQLPVVTTEALRECIVPHKTLLHLLAAPDPEQPCHLPAEKLAGIFLAAAGIYQNVVVDAAQPLVTEQLGACLELASAILPVLIPDILALQGASFFLALLEKHGFSLGKCHPVVNMADLSPDLPFEEINAYFLDMLKRPLAFQLPYEPVAAVRAVNQGLPVLQKGASEKLAEAFVQMIKGLLRLPAQDLSRIQLSGLRTQTLAQPLSGGNGEHGDKPAASASKALVKVSHAIAGWTPESYRQMKQTVHKRLVQDLQLNKMPLDDPEQRKAVRAQLRDQISEIMLEEKFEIAARQERVLVIEEIIDEALGLGPLETLLKDPSITEIMVNGPNKIYIERRGKLELTPRQFLDEKQLRVIIDRVVAPIGRRVDESSPMVDARLPDGSRVNIVIPPLALDGAAITIRKFPKERYTIQDYLDMGSLSPEMAEFLEGAVAARLNILISGGTGSGKTTLLNILSSFIPHGGRLLTIEDAAELQMNQEHVIRLESRPANIEGKGQVAIRDLVRNALRMRPDRIIVGEVRGGEALDMLQAMNTGHEGSLTTGHANSPRDALARLETMVLMAGVDLPVRAIREQIASALDLVIHQSRMRDGTRKVTNIIEITGMEGEVITLQDIFKFRHNSLDSQGRVLGQYEQANIRPQVLDKFAAQGVKIPHCFSPEHFARISGN